MLSIFIAIAIALVVVALALIVWPLVKKDHDDGLSRRKADNLAILRQQYEELEADHKAGRVSDDEYEETRGEIETRVLEESKDPEDAVPLKQGKQGIYAAFALVVIIPFYFICKSVHRLRWTPTSRVSRSRCRRCQVSTAMQNLPNR